MFLIESAAKSLSTAALELQMLLIAYLEVRFVN